MDVITSFGGIFSLELFLLAGSLLQKHHVSEDYSIRSAWHHLSQPRNHD